MQKREDRQINEAAREIEYIQKLRDNFHKMKSDFVKNREEMYIALRKRIKNDLNENKVYDEISKVKAILARQINELKSLCKTEFYSREKSDVEILMSLEKYKEIFEQEFKNKYMLT